MFSKKIYNKINNKRIIEYRRHIVGKRETCQFLVPKDYPINIDKVKLLIFLNFNIIDHFLFEFKGTQI
jgi:hypothetical protein